MSFESKLDVLSTQLLEVLNENKILRKKVGQLNVKLLDIERFKNTEVLSNVAQEKVYSKFFYCQCKAHNIILFKVPEPSNSSGQTQYISIFNDIFKTIDISVNPKSTGLSF